MSTLSTLEYKVVHFDADMADNTLSEKLTQVGSEGWKFVDTYHLHHRNAVFFIFSRETGPAR
jgi:hypothetical protein